MDCVRGAVAAGERRHPPPGHRQHRAGAGEAGELGEPVGGRHLGGQHQGDTAFGAAQADDAAAPQLRQPALDGDQRPRAAIMACFAEFPHDRNI